MAFQLARRPRDRDELHALITALWGVKLPRVSVCDGHVSPFEAVAHAFFGEDPNFAVWYASRGSGKSLALAVLGLTKALVDEADVTILGGSMTQSVNVRIHMAKFLAYRNAPMYAIAKDNATLIETQLGASIKPLPASQTTVRGPHPPLQLLDEIDEMDWDIYQAALGQAMEQTNVRGEKVLEYIVASSTWQNPDGTMTRVIEDARDKGQPVFTWCWRELLEEHGGWMSRRFIENKRKTVSAQMWHVEYELNEPAASDRAIDLDQVEKYFIDYGAAETEVHKVDYDEWTWENPEVNGVYVVGADWGKTQDRTVIGTLRLDVFPRRLVRLRIGNRKPWPEMLGWFKTDIADYHAIDGKHDKTGLGSVVHDYLDDEDTSGFVFVGRARTEMLLAYITAFEHGHYRLPRLVTEYAGEPTGQHAGLARLHKSHRGVTVADVYAPSKWDSHLPDEVAMMGLAHRAAVNTGVPVEVPLVKRDTSPRKADAPFHVKPAERVTHIGTVEVVQEEEEFPLLQWVAEAGGTGAFI